MSAKYEFIDAQKAHYPIVKMCQWAQVSRSGYYEWQDRPASATARRREQLKRLVAAVFAVSDGTYGYRRIHAQLVRQGDGCSPELVRALMRELDLHPCQPRLGHFQHARPGFIPCLGLLGSLRIERRIAGPGHALEDRTHGGSELRILGQEIHRAFRKA